MRISIFGLLILLQQTLVSQYLIDIDTMVIYGSTVWIGSVDEGNNAKYNDSLTTVTRLNIDSSICHFLEDKLVTVETFDTNDIDMIGRTLDTIQFQREKKSKEFYIDESTANYLKQKGYKNWIYYSAQGFERTKENLKEERTKGALKGLATLGLVYNVPYKRNISMWCFIADLSTRKVLLINKYLEQLSDREFTQDNIRLLLLKVFKKLKRISLEKRPY